MSPESPSLLSSSVPVDAASIWAAAAETAVDLFDVARDLPESAFAAAALPPFFAAAPFALEPADDLSAAAAPALPLFAAGALPAAEPAFLPLVFGLLPLSSPTASAATCPSCPNADKFAPLAMAEKAAAVFGVIAPLGDVAPPGICAATFIAPNAAAFTAAAC
jgi:hypothetical protein